MRQKVIALTIVFTLLASSLLSVAVAVGQSIAKPSVPEMTLALVDGAVRVQIKNQPYSTYNDSEDHVITLYYHIRMKDHYEAYWHYTTYPVPVAYRLPDYFLASKSEFTMMDIPYSENSIGFDGQNFIYPSGQVDFEVEAFMGYSTVIGIDGSMSDPDDYFYFFKGEASGWSDSQTITISSPQYTPTPEPTASPTSAPGWLTGFFEGIDWETVAIALLVVAVVVLAVGLGVVWRRLSSIKDSTLG